MKFRWLFAFVLTFGIHTLHAQDTSELDAEPIDVEFLDGYIGVGGAFIQQFSQDEKGTRQNLRVEFARLRKWISIDARVGFGQGYTDYGAVFRLYRHWKFNERNSTGISAGAGLGGMYSSGVAPAVGTSRTGFIDILAAPFVRYIWDWGTGMGLGFDLEAQLVPYTMLTNKQSGTDLTDNRTFRPRVFLGVSLLFEVDQ